MPKQLFDVLDYCGPLVAALVFAVALLFLSFFLLNFLLISKSDDLTVFERFGSRHNLRLGPHSLKSINRRKECKYYEEAALAGGSAAKQGKVEVAAGAGAGAGAKASPPPPHHHLHHQPPIIKVDAASAGECVDN